jgi:hypothetical protein
MRLIQALRLKVPFSKRAEEAPTCGRGFFTKIIPDFLFVYLKALILNPIGIKVRDSSCKAGLK